jgi:hypothetical protein
LSWLFGGSGGGISTYEAKPSYQSGVTQSSTKRTNPDVAYDANPSTGVVVYDAGSYYAVGGTSAGAPQWAGLVAIADQGAAVQGNAPLTGATQTLPALYATSQANFHDVISGNNGYSATAGYDLVTGRGTPKAQLIVNALVQAATTGGSGGGGSLGGGGGSSSPTFTQNNIGDGTHSLPRPPVGSLEQTGQLLSPVTLLPVTPVTTTLVGGTSASSATPLLILPAPAAFTTTAVLPTAAAVTAFTAAPTAAGAPTVTGLAAQATFTTPAAANSGGSGGGTLLGPALAQPAVPADGKVVPAGDEAPAPMPAVPDGGAAPGAVPGQPGPLPAGDEGAEGGAVFGWEDGECVTLPNSGAAVAALLMALGYCGKRRAELPLEDERRRDWLAR